MRALLTEELLRLGTAQARAAEEQAGPPPRGKPKKMLRVEVERPKRDVIFIYFDTYTRWAADPVRSKVVGDPINGR